MSDGLPVDPKSLGWGPAPSEAGTPEREMIATLLQMVRHHPFDHDTVRQERACDLCKTLEKAKALLRGRAAVGEPAPVLVWDRPGGVYGSGVRLCELDAAGKIRHARVPTESEMIAISRGDIPASRISE